MKTVWGRMQVQQRTMKRTGWGLAGAVLLTAGLLGAGLVKAAPATEEGIALAIVYDTSGSMQDNVIGPEGKYAPKYVVANKALHEIVEKVSVFETNSPSGIPRKIEAGLFVFQGNGAREAVKFGPFDAKGMRAWVQQFSKPAGGTPLGNAISAAGKAVLGSSLSHKHVVVITDGLNTIGPAPEAVVALLKRDAKSRGVDLALHFVAFDVKAKVFEPVKRLGVTVLGAADEQELNAQLGFIFEKKILLEDEEPAPAKTK